MVYFAQLPTGAIKIGCSVDVVRRLEQLKYHYKQPIALLHTIDGGLDIEREIHDRFAHLRLGGRWNREQFQPGPDLMEFIGKPLLVSQNPDAVQAVDTKMVPVRFEMAEDVYRRLERQAESLGVSRAIYARMKVIQGIKDDEKEGES